jgi:predicted kinase
MELIILVGLQGAGKSTFYRTHFAATHEHISKDRLRNNRRPGRRQRQLIETALQAGRSVVIDNTNPTVADRLELIDLARTFGATVVGFGFEPDLEGCLLRNGGRVGKERVPDKVLSMTLRKFQPPTYAEGFDRLLRVRLVQGNFEVDDWPEARTDESR